MKETLGLIEKSEAKEYYKEEFNKFTDEQKASLEHLIIKLKKAKSKNPLPWAFSQVKEGIPQFARFLILKNLSLLIQEPEQSINMAADFDQEMEAKFSEMKNVFGEEKTIDFLKTFSKGFVWNVIDFLEEGNSNHEEDGVNWALLELDQHNELTGKTIQGLHEDFLEFEAEF